MIDRSTPPEPGPPRRVRFPAFERSRLSNGLEIYAAPNIYRPFTVTAEP